MSEIPIKFFYDYLMKSGIVPDEIKVFKTVVRFTEKSKRQTRNIRVKGNQVFIKDNSIKNLNSCWVLIGELGKN